MPWKAQIWAGACVLFAGSWACSLGWQLQSAGSFTQVESKICFARGQNLICWCLGCCGPMAAGGRRVLGGEASGWRHGKLGEPAGTPGVHTAGSRGDPISSGQGIHVRLRESQTQSSMWPGDTSCLCASCRQRHHWLCLAGLGAGFGEGQGCASRSPAAAIHAAPDVAGWL